MLKKATNLQIIWHHTLFLLLLSSDKRILHKQHKLYLLFTATLWAINARKMNFILHEYGYILDESKANLNWIWLCGLGKTISMQLSLQFRQAINNHCLHCLTDRLIMSTLQMQFFFLQNRNLWINSRKYQTLARTYSYLHHITIDKSFQPQNLYGI